MHQLVFTYTHSYPNDERGVALPVVLRSGSHLVSLVVIIDAAAL